MTKAEYIKRARLLGYSQRMIDGGIKLYEAAKKDGIRLEYEMFLVELPIYD